MHREHLNEDEIGAATGQQEIREIDNVHAIALEINGTLSVMHERGGRSSLLQDVIET